jgi:hypothetical protein
MDCQSNLKGNRQQAIGNRILILHSSFFVMKVTPLNKLVYSNTDVYDCSFSLEKCPSPVN